MVKTSVGDEQLAIPRLEPLVGLLDLRPIGQREIKLPLRVRVGLKALHSQRASDPVLVRDRPHGQVNSVGRHSVLVDLCTLPLASGLLRNRVTPAVQVTCDTVAALSEDGVKTSRLGRNS